jgi:glycerol-3-phosphate acyltransferase PlsX
VRLAVDAVRDGRADAWVSIGHTGAVLAAATLTLGRLGGVTRAAVAVVIPGTAHDVVLLDVGGSVDISAEVLAQFGQLGRAYAIALGLSEAPRVGLLSIGTEPGKGDALRKEADALLRAAEYEYVGFVEGRDIAVGGPADVIVVDGFTGNVVLKALEGAAVNVGSALATLTGDETAAASVAAHYLSGSKAGAVLLGVNGITVLGHGGSTADEVTACIDLAVRLARHDLVGRTRQVLSEGSR